MPQISDLVDTLIQVLIEKLLQLICYCLHRYRIGMKGSKASFRRRENPRFFGAHIMLFTKQVRIKEK